MNRNPITVRLFMAKRLLKDKSSLGGTSPQKSQPANTVYCNLLPNLVYTVQCNALFTCEICVCVNVKVNINFNIVSMVMQTKWVQAHSLRLCLHHYWHNPNFDASTHANVDVDANSAISQTCPPAFCQRPERFSETIPATGPIHSLRDFQELFQAKSWNGQEP